MDLYVAGRLYENKLVVKDKDTGSSTRYTYDEVVDMVLNQNIVIKGVTISYRKLSKPYIESIYPYKPYIESIYPYKPHIEYIQVVHILTGIKLYVRDGYLIAVDTDESSRIPITLRLSDYIKGVDYFGFECIYKYNFYN